MNGGVTLTQQRAEISPELVTTVNSYRIGIVADKLAMSALTHRDDPQKFFHLCLSLARGIDYGVANNEPPAQASRLTPVLKQVCGRKKEFYLQSAIMVLMISVKNACKLGWFSAKDTEELLTLANEVGNIFCTKGDITSETSVLMPTLTGVMSRYYPVYKLGHVMASFEVKPGYGSYLVDFHITKDLVLTKDERIRLLVATKDSVETSSCIISPQQVNILLNGKPVDKRTNVFMDPGPQAPTIVNHLLKFGTNLLQAVGQFNGNYIFVIAAMTILSTSDLPAPQDYLQPDAILSGPDSEIIEGTSRISLNCPISYRRIKIPAKGHLCKHYQCFDLSNYVEINSKRPSWRCPHCNQSVGFTDLRVDRMMVKVLQEAGENVSEVTIYADGSWKVASSSGKDNSCDKAVNKQGELEADEPSGKSDGECNVFDLTGEDCEMDTSIVDEYVDKKPILHHDLQGESVFQNAALPSNPRSANESFQFPVSQAINSPSSGTSMRFETMTDPVLGNRGIVSVQTDAVSPSLNRQPNNFQGNNHPMNSIGLAQLSPTDSLQLVDRYYGHAIPRNVSRMPSAIQALPVQMPTQSPQQHVRPTMSLPAASGPSVPFQMPLVSTQQAASSVGVSVERQRQLHQSHINALIGMPAASMQNRAASSQGIGMSAPIHNNVWMHHQSLSQPPHLMRSPQTLSQPPHLMRSSPLQRSHPQQVVPTGVGANINSPSTVQRVQLTSSHPSQARQHPTLPSQPHLTRTSSSTPLNSSITPLAVSRTENLIDFGDQTWRPTGRMRGALGGHAYSAALSHMISGSTPTPRTHAMSSSAIPNHLQDILDTNRMISGSTPSPRTPALSSSAIPNHLQDILDTNRMISGSTPSPRTLAMSSSAIPNHLQDMLDTNRMIAHATQMPHRSTTDGATTGLQGEDLRG